MAAPGPDGQTQWHASSNDRAQSLDLQDPLRHMSREFLIPSKAELRAKRFEHVGMGMPSPVRMSTGC